MQVDLMRLDFRQAIEVIDYCLVHRIDFDKAQELRLAWLSNADLHPPAWVLDIPEELLTYFLLRWDLE